MREQRLPAALPRAPDDGRAPAGLRAVPDAHERLKAAQVRCPRCDKLLAEQLQGTLTATCPRCKHRVSITH